MRFRLIHLQERFSNWCVFNENTQRISVDGRPKRIEMYAFSKRISVDGAFPPTPFPEGKISLRNKHTLTKL